MVQFRAVRESVQNMRAAVASLSTVASETGGVRAELAEWTARQRAQRGSAPPPAPPLVSSSAPASALAAWTELQRRRYAEVDPRKPTR